MERGRQLQLLKAGALATALPGESQQEGDGRNKLGGMDTRRGRGRVLQCGPQPPLEEGPGSPSLSLLLLSELVCRKVGSRELGYKDSLPGTMGASRA